MSKDFNCRLCGNRSYRIVLDAISTPFEETFALYRCVKCNFVTTHPVPGEEELKKYYKDCYWRAQPPQAGGSSLENRFHRLRMRGSSGFIRSHIEPPGRILDWGAGDGSWVRLLRGMGYHAVGIDRYAGEPGEEFLTEGEIETADLPDNGFDAITCFHVLEHLPRPLQSFQAALKKLKPGGYMIIEVPNAGSLGFRIFGRRWQPLQVPTHLNHFDFETLRRMARDNRMKTLNTAYFSLRASPAALVLSLFPGLSPRRFRERYHRGPGLARKLIYAALQLLALPFGLMAALLKKGSIIRITLQKT